MKFEKSTCNYLEYVLHYIQEVREITLKGMLKRKGNYIMTSKKLKAILEVANPGEKIVVKKADMYTRIGGHDMRFVLKVGIYYYRIVGNPTLKALVADMVKNTVDGKLQLKDVQFNRVDKYINVPVELLK